MTPKRAVSICLGQEGYWAMNKLSVVVPYCENRPEKRAMLERAVGSFGGHDELILVWNQIGFSKAVNIGFRLAKGDYIIMASDDAYIVGGSLDMLCRPNAVTSPMVNGVEQAFSGVMWCVPRNIYEQYGMLDEGYSNGIYFEDEDYWMLLKTEGINHFMVPEVKILHPEGGATLTRTPDFNAKVEINRNYFATKWEKHQWQMAHE